VEVARKASTRLLELLDGAAEREPVVEYIQPELILRASTNR
jgi:DNA-binding LacI/PurR family transcriptional regulator